MKLKNIEKRAAVRSVVVSTLFQLVLAGCFLSFRTAVQIGCPAERPQRVDIGQRFAS